jgi:hypothetical protein
MLGTPWGGGARAEILPLLARILLFRTPNHFRSWLFEKHVRQ